MNRTTALGALLFVFGAIGCAHARADVAANEPLVLLERSPERAVPDRVTDRVTAWSCDAISVDAGPAIVERLLARADCEEQRGRYRRAFRRAFASLR